MHSYSERIRRLAEKLKKPVITNLIPFQLNPRSTGFLDKLGMTAVDVIYNYVV